ncbi:hypothetical protein [Virgibacillus sp. Bac332]|uniref:hypothetical protein n=1 Tax=Virgibacillus sp. Bac332 TaxID=2419842 RepID=UPI000EF4F6F5|nr:hypothetical protein [Virgibacillus sp. Bac332]
MDYIAHRINTVAQLNKLPKHYGVEIDLRDAGGRIILQHDPFEDGEDLEEFLQHYQHGCMILNIKSERIEHKVQTLLKNYHITNYFFLDSSFPMIYELTRHGERNIAIRFSEFEGIDTILAMQGRVNWVWIDCFTRLPIDRERFTKLKQAGFKLCLVSPELQGRPEDITNYQDDLLANAIHVDAICTKREYVHLWEA